MKDTSSLFQMMVEWLQHHQTTLKHISISMGAGVTSYLSTYLKNNEFEWKRFIAHLFIAFFTGYILSDLALQFVSPKTAIIGALLGGYLGANALDLVALYAKNYFDKKFPKVVPKTIPPPETPSAGEQEEQQ